MTEIIDVVVAATITAIVSRFIDWGFPPRDDNDDE